MFLFQVLMGYVKNGGWGEVAVKTSNTGQNQIGVFVIF